MKFFADVARGRDNNFNLLRVVAATSVMFSHSWPMVLGPTAVEPLHRETGYNLGILAVFVFFAISGFFITKSFCNRDSLVHFLIARISRLYPALFVALLLTVLFLGFLSSLSPGSFFSRAHTWTYVLANLSLRFAQADLPGVFTNNPYGNGVNGSLWTLFYEVACYGMVVAVGLLGMLRSRFFGIFFAFFAALQLYIHWGLSEEVRNNFIRLSLPFAVGMACYVWRSFVPLSRIVGVVLIGFTALVSETWAYQLLFPIAIAYVSLLVGFADIPLLRKYNAVGDYSYGIYIYAFPVQQATVCILGAITPWLLISIAFPITLILAIFSWAFIERPALDRYAWLASRVVAIGRRWGLAREGYHAAR